MKVHVPESLLAQAGERVVGLRCGGRELAAERIVLSGDHVIVRDLPGGVGDFVDVEVTVSPGVQEVDGVRQFGVILVSVRVEL